MDNGVILVYGDRWSSFKDRMLAIVDVTERIGNTTVAEIAAIGRRDASTQIEDGAFRMGGTYWKNWTKDPNQPRGTYWDSKLGGYASKTRKVDGRGLREMGFNFESKKATKNNRTFKRSISVASMYSLTANLWEKPHQMGYGTEKFQWSYDQRRWFYWKSGTTRPGRPFFLTGVKGVVRSSVPDAQRRIESKYRKELENL